MILRQVRESDSEALRAIYAPYIETSVTFEYTLPTAEEFADRIAGVCAMYPYLIAEEDGRILGYAYAHRAWERAAYQWGVGLSVYLAREVRGHGIGRALYGALLRILERQGFTVAYGVVTSPNPRSEHLHESMGFVREAVFRNAGYKNGQWRDVTWFAHPLAPMQENPLPPTPIGEIPPAEIDAILRQSETEAASV